MNADSDFEERLAEARQQNMALGALLESKGWSMLCVLLQDQITQRTNKVMLLPLGEPEGNATLAQQEFMKGEVAGIRTMLNLPATLLSNAAAMVESLTENEDGRPTDAAGSRTDAGGAGDFDPGSPGADSE